MAQERYTMGSSRKGPRVQRAQKMTINEQGEFSTPAGLSELPESYLGQSEADERSDKKTQILPDTFIYDDDYAWKQPIEGLPIIEHWDDTAAKKPAAPPKNTPSARKAQQTRSSQKGRSNSNERDRKRSRWRYCAYITVILVNLTCLALLGIIMMPQTAGYFWRDLPNYAFINGELLRYDADTVSSYKQYRNDLANPAIYSGIFVDGMAVGGMTVEEARTALTGEGATVKDAFSVTIYVGNLSWTLNSGSIPVSRDLGNVLERAYAIGRTNTTAIQHTLATPFSERVNTVSRLRENGVNLTTTLSYDHDAVQAVLDEIGETITRDPVNAQLQSFDYSTRNITCTEDQPGIQLDQETMSKLVFSALDNWEKSYTITLSPTLIQADITDESIIDRFTMIAAYTTTTTKDANRNTNIDLACRAITGTNKPLMPGETFSFNATTGERTTAKGYKSAGAIAAGQSIEEVGGGICQVSSTIFNAVARANLEITSRSPHAWPSSYVNKGEDATVNWPNLDFKFKNNTQEPIFLVTYYKDRKLTAEIWGMSLGEGVTIDLESKVIRTIQPPDGINYVQNPALAAGDNKLTVKARTGYVVETYKVWYLNGKETSRELLHTSTYKAYQEVVEYN